MGADIKQLRTRIKSVDSTLHLTKAMGLVASSKIRRAVQAMLRGREYSAAVEVILRTLSASPECRKSPYMAERGTERTRIIVVAGDRGMCGGYNVNIFRKVSEEFADAELIPLGRKACTRYGKESVSSESFSLGEAVKWAERLCREFVSGEYDRLGIVSTCYVSAMIQEPQFEWILPLSGKEASARPVIFEPDELSILNTAVPEYVAGKIMAAVKESFASEVTARRTAMDSAGRNAQEMIDNLTIQFNRARQGAITQEITEIVAGSQGGL